VSDQRKKEGRKVYTKHREDGGWQELRGDGLVGGGFVVSHLRGRERFDRKAGRVGL
jgi:hypothetical protein